MNTIIIEVIVSHLLLITGVYCILYSLTAKTSIPRDKTKPPIIKVEEIFVLGIILLILSGINALSFFPELL